MQQWCGAAGAAVINRYFDVGNQCFAAKLLPGQFYLSRDETIVTVLGRGVAACIRDRVLGLGGMTHVLEPDGAPGAGSTVLILGRLVEALIAAGARPEGLEAKLFGASIVGDGPGESASRTLEAVRAFLGSRAIRIVAEDVGGRYPRKIDFYCADGRVRIKRLRDLRNDTILRRDRAYLDAAAGTVAVSDPIAMSD